MVLFQLHNRSDTLYHLFAVGSTNRKCELLEFLNKLEENYRANRDDLYLLLDRIARDGPPRIADICHKVSREIWVLVKGDLRIFWFYGEERRMIICTHGIIKKDQKAKRAIKHAEEIREAYLREASKGKLVIVPSAEEIQ